MASPRGRPPHTEADPRGSFMLSVATLSHQQLSSKSFENEISDVGNRIRAVLESTPGHRKDVTVSRENDAKSNAQGVGRTRPRRRRKGSAAPAPTRGEICAGWSDLLGEISSSSRRVRVAKGGHFGAKASGSVGAPSPPPDEVPFSSRGGTKASVVVSEVPADTIEIPLATKSPPATDAEANDDVVAAEADSFGGAEHEEEELRETPQKDPTLLPRSPASSSGLGAVPRSPRPTSSGRGACGAPEAAEAVNWRSYRIDEAKVPDSVLSAMWNRAVDPKHCTDEFEALAKVPRMTVTHREVEQLPPVNDIQHWRAVKTNRRARRKARAESECFPPLNQMMRTIFGEEVPAKRRVHGLYAQMKEFYEHQQRPSVSSTSGWTPQKTMLSQDAASQEELEEEAQETLKAAAATEAEEDALIPNKKPYLGVRRKGRRGAFDEGQPWQRGNAPLAEIEEQREQQRLRNSRVRCQLETSQQARYDDEHTTKLNDVSQKVNEQCQRKVLRMHAQFVRKQGQLSARLTRRVQRLQMDYQETQDTKVGSILPSVVAWEGAKSGRGETRSSPSEAPVKDGNAAGGVRGDTVFEYLQHHRHRAEQERQSHHSIYLQQVERFQGYLKLLADPNRIPDRGELYLSDAFRHVLAAGLIIDNAYFIRALRYLEAEDFEKTATVNLLAACCVSFSIDLRQYWAHLKRHGVTRFAPQPQVNEARSWEDWAPWNGVRLEHLLPSPTGSPAVPSGEEILSDEHVEMREDPCPFAPIVPDETPSISGLVSRGENDPLMQILQKIQLDLVLERYKIEPGEKSMRQSPRREVDDAFGEEYVIRNEPTPTGSSASTHTDAPGSWRGQLRTPLTPTKDKSAHKSSTPPPAAGSGRAGTHGRAAASKKNLTTLQRTRGVAEPISEMPGAPDKDRPRAGAQKPAMTSIAEGPLLE